MSGLGQTRKSVAATAGSAFPSGADIIGQVGHVRKVPKAEMTICHNSKPAALLYVVAATSLGVIVKASL
jgi:hypothetical protein